MGHTIKPGQTGRLKITVKKEYTAAHYGSGLLDVLATPAMIGFMEKTAHESVQSFLEDGYITLGTSVNIKHIKATPLNEQVAIETVVTLVEGNKITFEVIAHDEHGKIGVGTHKRAVVHAETFTKTLNNA